MRIMVLDDSLARHEIFKKRLAGHDVTHVTTRDEAIKALNEQPQYDVAYLDHSLGETEAPLNPGVTPDQLPSGMHVVDHIKTLPSEKRPKTCIVHSCDYHPSHEMVLRLRDAGIEADRQPFTV
jgi:CheY-like chemotaxis protein